MAAARGMPLVVQYLLDCPGSDEWRHEKGTSRFRLFTKPRKSVNGTFSPLEFALKMKNAEMQHGATSQELKSLNKCIELLRSKDSVASGEPIVYYYYYYDVLVNKQEHSSGANSTTTISCAISIRILLFDSSNH